MVGLELNHYYLYLSHDLVAKCDYPILNDTQTVYVDGYVDPSLEGTTVNFSCPQLARHSLDQGLQHVWGMENGISIQWRVISDAEVNNQVIFYAKKEIC